MTPVSASASPAPHPDAPYIVGVDIGGTNVRAALVDRAGRILQDARRPSLADHPSEATLAAIHEAVAAVMQAQGIRGTEVVGIGVGLPGIMDSETGVVFWSPNFTAWENVLVPPAVGDPLGLPTYILNDARCAALGELQFGAGRGARHMVMITLGTGIGGAFVVDGRLLLGPNGSIGEVGHMTIDPDGPRCGCGNFGCWEKLCARDAMVERALRKIQAGRATLLVEQAKEQEEITPALIAEAAAGGDALAREVMEETGFYVGLGVANLINIMNPEVFVVGGGIAQAGEALFAPLRRTVRARAVALQQRTARILPAELGDNAGVMGGVVLALQRSGALHP
jgi:glucokinase